jgi:hypothetical protein
MDVGDARGELGRQEIRVAEVLRPADIDDGDRFGASVAVRGSTILVGAPGDRRAPSPCSPVSSHRVSQPAPRMRQFRGRFTMYPWLA